MVIFAIQIFCNLEILFYIKVEKVFMKIVIFFVTKNVKRRENLTTMERIKNH